MKIFSKQQKHLKKNQHKIWNKCTHTIYNTGSIFYLSFLAQHLSPLSGTISPLFTCSLLWNSLPSSLRHPDVDFSRFRNALATYMGFPVTGHTLPVASVGFPNKKINQSNWKIKKRLISDLWRHDRRHDVMRVIWHCCYDNERRAAAAELSSIVQSWSFCRHVSVWTWWRCVWKLLHFPQRNSGFAPASTTRLWKRIDARALALPLKTERRLARTFAIVLLVLEHGPGFEHSTEIWTTTCS